LVTAINTEALESLSRAGSLNVKSAASGAQNSGNSESNLPPIVLNSWAAEDLAAKPGDVVSLDYYLWEDEGRLITRKARFKLAGVTPIEGAANDKDLVPDYPGITQTQNISDWDPPFPVDLKLVRPKDEDYWHKYRTTPKAFITLETGVRLWASRHGNYTS